MLALSFVGYGCFDRPDLPTGPTPLYSGCGAAPIDDPQVIQNSWSVPVDGGTESVCEYSRTCASSAECPTSIHGWAGQCLRVAGTGGVVTLDPSGAEGRCFQGCSGVTAVCPTDDCLEVPYGSTSVSVCVY